MRPAIDAAGWIAIAVCVIVVGALLGLALITGVAWLMDEPIGL